MGLIDELSHVLVEYYRKNLDPKVMAGALEWFDSRIARLSWTRPFWPSSSSFRAAMYIATKRAAWSGWQGKRTAMPTGR